MLQFSRRCSFFVFFLLALGVSPRFSDAASRPFWPIPALSSLDGARWGDLELGRTTFKQVQARYETGKGAYSRSTALSQAKNTPIRVDLLWNKCGGDEILAAIAVRFIGIGPRRAGVERLFESAASISKIEENLEENGDDSEANGGNQANEVSEAQNAPELFWPGRTQDWRVVYYAPRGVAIFTLRQNVLETAPLILFTSPNGLESLQAQLSSEFQPVEERIDPHENEEKVMEFGTISISLDNDLDLPAEERSRTKEIVRDADADGTIRYWRGGNGTYRVSMSGSRKRDGGSVSVSVSIDGKAPYGAISASGSGSDSWKWTDRDDWRDREDKVVDSYRDALREAMRQAENSFASQILRAGPPPLSVLREAQWTQIIENTRKSGLETDLATGILR